MLVLHYLYLYEAYFIENLQNLIPHTEGFFMLLTKVADPAYAISIVFPVTASVNTGLASAVLVTSVASEWINTLLKWILMEDRPYWWVKESGIRGVELHQTSLTCETGPGSPSGHVMGSAAVLYVFLRFFIDYCVNSDGSLRYQTLTEFTYCIKTIYIGKLLTYRPRSVSIIIVYFMPCIILFSNFCIYISDSYFVKGSHVSV